MGFEGRDLTSGVSLQVQWAKRPNLCFANFDDSGSEGRGEAEEGRKNKWLYRMNCTASGVSGWAETFGKHWKL